MLMQNWFCQPNMEMFYDRGDFQKFYDKNSHAIYIVEETNEGTKIREIKEESGRYLSNLPDEDLDELYETTIDISMCGLTTKIPFSAEPYNRIINVLNSLVNSGEVE